MGKASRKSDVFSFGIMLLEVFTGKKPTDTLFVGELSLRQWVHQAFPSRISHILDGNVQKDDEIIHHTSKPLEVSPGIMHSTLISVLELGMLCTSEVPGFDSVKDVCLKRHLEETPIQRDTCFTTLPLDQIFL